MSRNLISKGVLIEFREFLSDMEVLRTITQYFEAADVELRSDVEPELTGQRRTLVEQYYASLDLTKWSDICRLLRVFEQILLRHEKNAPDAVSRLVSLLRKDGYLYEKGRITPVTGTSAMPDIRALAEDLDASFLATQIERMEQAVLDDPSLAIGTAKEMVETVCKTILEARGCSVDGRPDLPKLVRTTMSELQITRDDIPDSVPGADTVRKMLSNLATLTDGLAELRNLHGTGHGREGRVRQPKPRWAKLAVGSAAVLSRFLLETHLEKPVV